MRIAVTTVTLLGVSAVLSTLPAAAASPSPSPYAPATESPSPTPSGSLSPTQSPTPTESPTPTPSPTTGPYGIPMGQKIREDSWCRILLPNRKGDAAEADSIMDDNIVDMGQYGYYRLSKNPNWARQSTLDSSGNDHINGLHWTVPLLYTGAKRDDVPMVERFFDLIGDWLSKHKKKSTRTWAVTQPIIAGERLWTLTCASDISDGQRFRKATRKEANRQLDAFRLGGGTNNTGIHQQGSALAAFCYLDEREKARRAADNLNKLADYLILADGSDREGSPWYAYYSLRLLNNVEAVYDRCGFSFREIRSAIDRSEKFLAAAVDPNFYLVMKGDTHRAKLSPNWFAPGSVVRWAATEGKEGEPPQKLYQTFSGGYVFGRNSWTNIDGHKPTFYSVRSARPYVTAHVHSDLGSVTFNSYGTEWIGDPGPYRYDSSAIRDYMVSRSGHSVIRVTEKKTKKKASVASVTPRFGLGVPQLGTSSESSAVLSTKGGPYDQTCIKDGTYIAARLKRCVYYDTSIDGLVVVDRIRAKKRIRVDQRWMAPNGVKIAASSVGATMTSPTAAARVIFAGGGSVRTYRPSSKRADGWFTNEYGELVKGTVLQRSVTLAKGKKRTWTTVIAAGETTPGVSIKDNTVYVTRKTTTDFPIPAMP